MDMKILGMRDEILPAQSHRFFCVHFEIFLTQGIKLVVVF